MPRRVLVTRPAPETQRTARRLTELGYEPVMLPLTQTVALPVDAASLPERIDAVAVTSSNALRNASPGLIARLAGKPCFAVGDKTARQALSLDFSGGPGSTESERHPLSGLLRKPPLPLRGRGKAPSGPAGRFLAPAKRGRGGREAAGEGDFHSSLTRIQGRGYAPAVSLRLNALTLGGEMSGTAAAGDNSLREPPSA